MGFRTENPGPFLSWPLPSNITLTDVTRLPNSPWTHNFLGISDCPAYPALIDDGYWGGVWYSGQFDTYALPSTTKDRVRWQNIDDPPTGNYPFYNAFACYGQTVPAGGHAGTDMSAGNETDVKAAANGTVVSISTIESCGSNSHLSQYKVAVRHDNVNGSGQTWYTIYRHVINPEWSLLNQAVSSGTKIAEVGCDHLHFETAEQPDGYVYTLNTWGIDQAPWDGCLWLDHSLCPTMENPPTDFNQDGYPDIYAIKRTGTGTNSTEVHILNGSDDFQSWLLQTGTIRPETGTNNAWAFATSDYNRDGKPDIYAIKRTNTGTNSTEVHILNGSDNFQSWLLQTGTIRPETGTNNAWAFAVSDYNNDKYPDVYLIKRAGTGTNSMEVHILNGADNFQSWLLQTGTIRPELGESNAWAFGIADYNRDGNPDIYLIKRTSTGTNSTEVHVLNGADNFQSWLLQTGTIRPETGTNGAWAFGISDYNRDGYPDIYLIKRAGTGTNSTEVHVMDGANDFQSWLLQTGTIRPETGTDCSWMFAFSSSQCFPGSTEPPNNYVYLPMVKR